MKDEKAQASRQVDLRERTVRKKSDAKLLEAWQQPGTLAADADENLSNSLRLYSTINCIVTPLINCGFYPSVGCAYSDDFSNLYVFEDEATGRLGE